MEKLIEKINNDAHRYDETIYKKANETDISYFENWWGEKLNAIDIPNEFLNFIKNLNGFDYNGLSFYSINEKDNNNFYESNEIYRENENLTDYIFFGEDGISWYCKKVRTNEYFVLDKPSGSVTECFNNFDELIISALNTIL